MSHLRLTSHFSRLTVYILLLIALSACRGAHLPDSITGVVRGEAGPLPGAVVRVQTTEKAAVTDAEGQFTLTGLSAGQAITLTAWAPGYYIGGGEKAYLPGAADVTFTLEPHAEKDHPDYAWVSAFAETGEDDNCENCHSAINSNPKGLQIPLGFPLPFDEWVQDAHAQSAQNPRFVSMYLGTDVHGNQSPITRIVSSRDYGEFPLPPDPDQPYYGPGYKLDFPDTDGDCATCHAPAVLSNDPYGVDPTTVEGVSAEGVGCDFCHKIIDVRLNPITGLPYPNMPGVMSFEFLRPPEGHQLFAGPYDDVAPGEDIYAPVFRESQFCAACHFGVFWDTLIYNSFGEWLESDYSDPESGQTCQDCHMPPSGADRFVRAGAGGLERDPATIFSHKMPGAMDEELLQNTVTLDVEAERQGEAAHVTVTVANTGAGHHIPTDSPLRQIILLVEASDAQVQPLSLIEGATLPDWAGVGDPSQGYFAGLPGVAYAKILEETWSQISPTGSYWKPTRVVSDNRIPALGSDTSVYVFAHPNGGDIQIKVTLLFRRAFIELMDQKGWDVADIVMAEQLLVLIGDWGQGTGDKGLGTQCH